MVEIRSFFGTKFFFKNGVFQKKTSKDKQTIWIVQRKEKSKTKWLKIVRINLKDRIFKMNERFFLQAFKERFSKQTFSRTCF